MRKAPSKMFGIVLNTPLGYAHFVYIVQDQFVTVLWFKDFYEDLDEYQSLEIWFIVELYKEIPPLFSLFLKILQS